MECVERGLDPLDTCLVVADKSRTEKTICLAVSPALKSYGIGGRPRLFEVVERVKEVNRTRGRNGKSFYAHELNSDRSLAVDYLVAPPRMAHYLDYSSRIYKIYLKYLSPEDIHVYSIDEVFMDVTDYLPAYRMSAHDLAMTMIRDVLARTGVTATAGIGTNLYLCKIAMDIVAKKMEPDKDGVRIASLDEITYRRKLWDHLPLTDFWRVGHGISRRLSQFGILTMGDIARCSLENEELLYKLFGINAELLIDHAWGWEPVTLKEIRSYEPETHSISSGQVLTEPYTAPMARVVALEMADALALEMVEKGIMSDQLVVHIGYDVESLTDPDVRRRYHGPVSRDYYGRLVPVHSHGTANIGYHTSSSRVLIEKTGELFDRIVNFDLLIRRLNITANHLMRESDVSRRKQAVQLDLFSDYESEAEQRIEEKELLKKERKGQEVMLKLKRKFGKNIILKGINFADGDTQKQRNRQIGGHQA